MSISVESICDQMLFVERELHLKPAMVDMEDYFSSRLRSSSSNLGMEIFKDNLGNVVFTSPLNTELTFSGDVPCRIVLSNEGKRLILQNSKLLRQIQEGSVRYEGKVLGGSEGCIYKIPLQTDEGSKDFALKCGFPIGTIGSERRYFSSGIAAMYLMQLAEREKPVPYVNYVSPILATHDITIAPYVSEGHSTNDFWHLLYEPGNKNGYKKFLDNYQPAKRIRDILKFILDKERKQRSKKNFYTHFEEVLNNQNDDLCEWTAKKCKSDNLLIENRFTGEDTSLYQSVVSIEEIFPIFQRFYSDPKFDSSHPEFIAGVLRTISMVELGIGILRLKYI